MLWEHQSLIGRLRKSAYEGSQQEIKMQENQESTGLETNGLEFQDEVLCSATCHREIS